MATCPIDPLANLLALFPDNNSGAISAADMRQFITSLYNTLECVNGAMWIGAAIPIVSNTTVTQNHNFGQAPRFAGTMLKCVTAGNGYSPGDLIFPPNFMYVNQANTAGHGHRLVAGNINTISVTFNTAAAVYLTKVGTTEFTLPNVNWELYMLAWK